jgi:hypothetical protein
MATLNKAEQTAKQNAESMLVTEALPSKAKAKGVISNMDDYFKAESNLGSAYFDIVKQAGFTHRFDYDEAIFINNKDGSEDYLELNFVPATSEQAELYMNREPEDATSEVENFNVVDAIKSNLVTLGVMDESAEVELTDNVYGVMEL